MSPCRESTSRILPALESSRSRRDLRQKGKGRSMRTIRYLGLIGLLLALVGMGALACASDSAPALDETQLRSIVEDAVAKSAPEPQQQVSAQEIKAMVESSMMDMASSQVSAQEIQAPWWRVRSGPRWIWPARKSRHKSFRRLVQSAVMAITADAVTNADVQARDLQGGHGCPGGHGHQRRDTVDGGKGGVRMPPCPGRDLAEEIQSMVESASQLRRIGRCNE